MGYKKEEFSSFSSNETDYQNARGLLSIDLDDDIYYDESNGNVIVFDGNMAKVLTGIGRTYNTYDMTSPSDVSAMNSLPQIFTPTKFPYCYEIIKDEKYLIFIPGIKSKNTPFVSIINNDDLSNILMDPPNAPITKLNSKNYKNYLTLFNIDPTNNLYYDTDTMNVIHIVGNVARVIDGSTGKTVSYDLMNQNDITSMNNIPRNANITITTYLYEIKPASKYMIYIPSTEGTFISIIDTSSSKNLATTGTAQNAASPNVTGSTPNVTVPTPNVTGSTPSVTVPTPNVTGSTPSVTVTTPNVTGSTPSVTVPTPYLGKEISSSLGPAAPVVTGVTSSLGPAAPVVTGVTSSLGPAAPVVTNPANNIFDEKYSVLNDKTIKILFRNMSGLRTHCPKLMQILENWYSSNIKTSKTYKGRPVTFNDMDNDGIGGSTWTLLTHLIDFIPEIDSRVPTPQIDAYTVIPNGSDFGKYEDQLIAKGDVDGSKTFNIKNGKTNITLKKTLDDYAVQYNVKN